MLLLALPGCLVSFNDYPLGDPQGAPNSGGKSSAGGVSAHAGASGRGGVTSGGSSASTAGASMGGSSKAGDTNDAGSPDPGNGGTTSVPNALMVDDFEDGNQNILELQGRSGAWYAANDGKGTQTPRAGVPLMPSLLEPARETSTHGAHTFGGPFPTWGALVGTAFASSGDNTIAYDLSAYHGLRLWVRSGSMYPNAANKLRVNLRTPATMTGGGCTVCTDHFGADIPLTSKWVQVELPLAMLKQSGYGRPMLPSPDLRHVMAIELLFAANVTFDLWIDDLELY
jgi:hypothetical protein